MYSADETVASDYDYSEKLAMEMELELATSGKFKTLPPVRKVTGYVRTNVRTVRVDGFPVDLYDLLAVSE